jgi:putative phosphoesterase
LAAIGVFAAVATSREVSGPQMIHSKERRVRLKKGRIGLISDTHGFIRPEAVEKLRGVEIILHAGDIGRPEVLTSLQALAPVVAVKGNVDRGEWARAIPDIVNVRINDVRVQLIHDVHDIASDLRAAGYSVVVSGHSHRPLVTRRDDLLWINPGSAGPRRFNLPVTMGLLLLRDAEIRAEIIDLL